MKNAEDVAKEILIKVFDDYYKDGKSGTELRNELIAEIATALREFRYEALGEAEGVAENFEGGSVNPPYDWIAVRTGIAKSIRSRERGKS